MSDNDDQRAVLRLEGVRFGFDPAEPVVDGVSGSLAAGRVTAVLGPNAAGKTTLLRLMLGQLRPDVGRVTLDGEDVSALPPRARARRMSYVPQRGGVSFAFTVWEVVAMGRFAGPRDDAAVGEALSACGLLGLEGRVFAELSGGQQQRVLVARALAQSRGGGRAMLLDEPGSGLDLRHVHAMMRALRGVAGRGLAVAVVLHDLNLAARYADAVWLMSGGRLAASGGWREVLRPETLGGVYGVGLRVLEDGPEGRPVFVAEPPAGTLTATPG